MKKMISSRLKMICTTENRWNVKEKVFHWIEKSFPVARIEQKREKVVPISKNRSKMN